MKNLFKVGKVRASWSSGLLAVYCVEVMPRFGGSKQLLSSSFFIASRWLQVFAGASVSWERKVARKIAWEKEWSTPQLRRERQKKGGRGKERFWKWNGEEETKELVREIITWLNGRRQYMKNDWRDEYCETVTFTVTKFRTPNSNDTEYNEKLK